PLLCLCCLSFRGPPGSTLFPYTTLFRSALAARLKRLNVPALVVEKNARPGDSWRKRYKSLCLHDPVWYDHMPYIPFPDHWPVFSDRKSTRLNSSHQIISYAVFCLKKKNK